MKKICLCLLPLLLLLACKKDPNADFDETITSGSKWGIKVGSIAAEVYAQLQVAGLQNDFNSVEVVKLPYSSPAGLQNIIPYYLGILLQSPTQTETVALQFQNNQVSSIYVANILATKWPQTTPDAISIHQGDAIADITAKLIELYKLPAYQNYKIFAFNKPLAKPFDPDMANHPEWVFNIFKDVKPGRNARSNVRLVFKDGILKSIKHEYRVFDYYD